MHNKAKLNLGSKLIRSLSIILILTLLAFAAYAIRESVFNDDGTIRVYPDNPDMAADYMLHYAMMNSETDILNSKMLIYDSDIQYVENLIKNTQENCIKNNRASCSEDLKDYQDALTKLTNVKSQQTGSPPKNIETLRVSSEDSAKTKPSALSQLSIWLKKMKDLLAKVLKGWVG